MKYFEVTFNTTPCNETVNDVVSALAGEIGFESFVEWENGVQAYVQQSLFDEEALKEMIAGFPLPDTQITYEIKRRKTRIGTRNGKRISSNPSSSATVVAYIAPSTRTLRKQNTRFSSIRRWPSELDTTKPPAPSFANCWMPT